MLLDLISCQTPHNLQHLLIHVLVYIKQLLQYFKKILHQVNQLISFVNKNETLFLSVALEKQYTFN